MRSRSNWNLEMLVFMEEGKPEYPEKNPRSKDENQPQTLARASKLSGFSGYCKVMFLDNSNTLSKLGTS